MLNNVKQKSRILSQSNVKQCLTANNKNNNLTKKTFVKLTMLNINYYYLSNKENGSVKQC